MKKNLVVIGNGMVGYKFCEKLIAKGGNKSYNIIVFGEEVRPAYDRVHLSEYIDNKSVDQLTMASKEWYYENHITLILADPIINVDLQNKVVNSQFGQTVNYEFLVFATGSYPFVPNITGVQKQGVFVYRTIEDLDLIINYSKKVKSAAVIGGGLLGLEAAKAILDLGIKDSHVIEFASRLMPRQIDDAGSNLLKGKLKELGISVHCNKNTQEILGEDRIEGLAFTDGEKLKVDMLVISAGIKPRDEIAKKAGLEVGPRGGIIVNDQLQTSDSAVFAIGECALHNEMIYGLVAPGYEMAEIVASQLTSNNFKLFSGFDMSTKLKLIGVDVASFGDPFLNEPECSTIIFENKNKGIYKRINVSNDNQYLLGGILIGDASQYNILLQTVNNKILIAGDPEDLILGTRGGENENSNGVMALPGEAIICSCEAITKNMLVCEIDADNTISIEKIKKSTKACSGCGGCTPLVKDLIQSVLKSKGTIIRNVVCEHFDYTRQELLSLMKLNELKTFDETIQKLGRNDGCEICKPVVASLLASLWNENILGNGRQTAQDSNDRFLANIQRGGTYSVVPRIPGGEITPEKLVIIGQVAKKYGLYTKITGGQRIDMFGAHVSDLPSIWEELIEAGFESGHAYGKALRTVKSCVGTTWCRFGVQDAVSFAIEVENRYKGLRSPHKLKSAVSGCIRECAEAQSKDFGIIATENGWNLYLGGNGGSKPRHADLVALDLTSENCLKLIDRFLMFYIKTAEPLQRTATWIDKMEGGINYLKSVIIDDVLGICDELEKEMQALVNNYKCEWKEAVETPEIRKRFVHFVNAPELKDPTVKFEEMRDQIKAQDWSTQKV